MVKVLTIQRWGERIDLFEGPNGEQMATCHVLRWSPHSVLSPTAGEFVERVIAIWSSSAGVALNRASATC